MRPREISIEGEIAFVPLTSGQVALIDAEDAHEVGQYNWHYSANGRKGGYAGRKLNGKTFRLHNLLLPSISGMFIDHIDGDPLNNRRSNLRYATLRENNRNSARKKQTGYKGVYFQKQKGIYSATLFLGEYRTAEEAAAAYDSAVKLIFPTFGRPNPKIQKEPG